MADSKDVANIALVAFSVVWIGYVGYIIYRDLRTMDDQAKWRDEWRLAMAKANMANGD